MTRSSYIRPCRCCSSPTNRIIREFFVSEFLHHQIFKGYVPSHRLYAKHQYRLTVIRSYQRLLPDIIVAKVQQSTSASSATSSRSYTSECQTASRSYILTPQAHNVCSSKQSSPAHALKPRKASYYMGTIEYFTRCFSPKNRWAMSECRKIEVTEKIAVQYQSPSWLSSRVWEIQVTKATSGWTFRPRVYNVVPTGSPVFRYAKEGNPQGMQELFSRNEASPFDCNHMGLTVLHVRLQQPIL